MEQFCRLVALPDEDGRTLSAAGAYRIAYPNARRPRAERLMKNLAVLDRIDDLRRQANEALMKQVGQTGIAVRANRIRRKNTDWQRLRELILARSAEFPSVPGQETGLLACVPKQIGGERQDVYIFDKAVLDALIELEESTARELGQRAEPTAATDDDDPVVLILPDNGH